MTQFSLDYTFFMNIAALALAGLMVWLSWRHQRSQQEMSGMAGSSSWGIQDYVTAAFALLLAGGLATYFVTGGQ